MKILLAEDDRATQLRLTAYLNEWGHETSVTDDGAEAWAAVQTQKVDCVITDWMMPNLSGPELIEKIRHDQQARKGAYVYLILLTGQSGKENLVAGMEAGADDFLTKPFDKDELRVRLRAGQRVIDLERQLAERNRELSMFTSVASHDLREPLRTISAFISLLQNKYKGQISEEADEYIQFVVDGATRMRNMIDDLLEFARMDSGKRRFELVDTAEIVSEVERALSTAIAECGAEIIRGDLPLIEGDRTQLRQLFQNLIGNGVKYRGEAIPVIRVGAAESNGEWVFRISDNGIGIAPEHRQAVFEPFRRLHGLGGKYSGSGVGLAICKKAVDRHGGRIWIETAEGGGSTFCFTTPMLQKEQQTDA